MKNFDRLADIVLNEAPISSYLKTTINPASYVRGTGKVMQGAGQAAGLFKTSSNYLSQGLTKAGTAAAGVGSPISGNKTEKEPKRRLSQQVKPQEQTVDFAKAKTNFIINNRQLRGKYIGSTSHGFPIYRIQGIPWAKSIVIEPKGKDKANVYFYPDKKPNLKAPPAAQRNGTLDFSPIQNNLSVRTK